MRRSYKYNEEFFGRWLSQNDNINRREILNVLDTKDYASLKRWASGYPMPVQSIIKICNHFNIPIENFFIGMLDITPKQEHSDTTEDVNEEPSDGTGDNNEAPAKSTYDYIPSAKRAQLEAHHTKEMYHAAKKSHLREDEIRRDYERRMDEQRRDFLLTINQLAEQLARVSTTTSNPDGNYNSAFLAERQSREYMAQLKRHGDIKEL